MRLLFTFVCCPCPVRGFDFVLAEWLELIWVELSWVAMASACHSKFSSWCAICSNFSRDGRFWASHSTRFALNGFICSLHFNFNTNKLAPKIQKSEDSMVLPRIHKYTPNVLYKVFLFSALLTQIASYGTYIQMRLSVQTNSKSNNFCIADRSAFWHPQEAFQCTTLNVAIAFCWVLQLMYNYQLINRPVWHIGVCFVCMCLFASVGWQIQCLVRSLAPYLSLACNVCCKPWFCLSEEKLNHVEYNVAKHIYATYADRSWSFTFNLKLDRWSSETVSSR